MPGLKIYENIPNNRYSYMTCLGKNKSLNIKTGDMSQISILNLDRRPPQAVKDKVTKQICGSCPLQGAPCYVNTMTETSGYLSTYKLPVSKIPEKLDKAVRFGKYGDPAFLPRTVIKNIIKSLEAAGLKKAWTMYTHQWMLKSNQDLKAWSMASVDKLSAKRSIRTLLFNKWGKTRAFKSALNLKRHLNRLGWRTFRILEEGDKLDKNEILCPNYTHGIQCADCLLCSGTEGRGTVDIAIPLHGSMIGQKVYTKS